MIWIEILSRHKEVVHRYRSPNGCATIGRAYDNCVVIDDPYVAPHHLHIRRDENGGIIVEDLATQNGMFDDRGKRHSLIQPDGNQLIRIGQTWLRVRKANFAVADERPLQPQRRLWPWMLALLIALPGLHVFSLWLNYTGEYSPSLYFGEMMSVAISIAIWIGFWSLLTRLLTGSARFTLHAIIALTGLLLLKIISAVMSWTIFAFSSGSIARYGFPVFWLLFALVCFAHLRAISGKNVYRKAAIVFSLAVCACVAQWLMDNPFMPEDDDAKRPYLTSWYPPSWRVVAPESENDFFAEAGRLKEQLDEARKKEPRRGLFDRFFDDFYDDEMSH